MANRRRDDPGKGEPDVEAGGIEKDEIAGRLTRRAVLQAAAVGVAAAGAGGYVVGRATTPETPHADDSTATANLGGPHQPGIATAQQTYACVAAFDFLEPARASFDESVKRLSTLAAALMVGEPGPARFNRDVADSGLADDLGPEGLTITFGFGPRIFAGAFGPVKAAPRRLIELPSFDGDRLDPRWVGGDVFVQICADDPTVVAHAIREVRARVPGVAAARWTHQGFLTKPGPGRTPRNLFGQLDGTANLHPGSSSFGESVWAAADEPDWMNGGTYVVLRKIRMLTPMWDLASAEEQNAALGRDRRTGAPLSGGGEHTPLDLRKTDGDGNPLIPTDAHVRIAHELTPIFRRSYNYDNGLALPASAGIPDEGHAHPPGTAPHDHGPAQPGMGHWDNGMLFMTYVRDPAAQYVPLQELLSRSDKLHTFLQHTGSAIFAVPGLPSDGEYIGQGLFG
ncbi:MAG TPA: Dyp-type peroxidase [Jiangellaceae bacterium]